PQYGSVPNYIRENASTNPDVTDEQSTLDTLYLAAGGSVPGPGKLPVMTYYHGFQSPQMVFSGFPLWFFQRAQVVELSDFVLQDTSGCARSGVAPEPARAKPATRPTAAATITRKPATAPLRR